MYLNIIKVLQTAEMQHSELKRESVPEFELNLRKQDVELQSEFECEEVELKFKEV